MSDFVLSSRVSLFSRVSSIALFGCLVASCSSGFQRFDSSFYNNAVPQQSAQNPYPSNIDSQTTASTARRLLPVSNVAPKNVPQGVYHQPEPTLVAPKAPQVYTPQAYKPYASQAQAPVARPIRTPLSQAHQLTQKPLSKPVYTPPVAKRAQVIQAAAGYTAPKPEIVSKKAYISKPSTDSLTTAAVKAAPVAAKVSPLRNAATPISVAAAPQATNDGWSAAGGTTIAVGRGETLYNISKRYGVPVSAIRSANGMSPGASLRAGEKVIIPNYVFTQSSGVSAPDNDVNTRAARASTGYIGEANPNNVAFPTKRPYQTAAVSSSGNIDETKRQRYVPKTYVEPLTEEQTLDYSVVTGSVKSGTNNSYRVQPGDNLSKIARNHGTSVSALQAANGLTGTNIRVGQQLNLPNGSTPTVSAPAQRIVNNKPLPANVDPIITSSVKPSSVDKDIKAPARTGISDFRWPVNGRVVSNFGDSGTNGKNDGIDISVPEGTAVKSAENGVVIYAGDEIASYGKLILVRHSDGWVSAYAHNRDFEVKKGDQVRRGQTIARSGRTGSAERPKLHFELRKDSSPVNPKKYLAG